MMLPVVVLLSGRIIEACVVLFSVMEYALELIAGLFAIRQSHASDIRAAHRVHRNDIVLLLSLEASDVVNVITGRLKALIQHLFPLCVFYSSRRMSRVSSQRLL